MLLPPSPSTFLPATWPQVCPIFPFKAFHISWLTSSMIHSNCEFFHPLPSIIIFVAVPFLSFRTRALTLDHESIYSCHTSLHQTRAGSLTFRGLEVFEEHRSVGFWNGVAFVALSWMEQALHFDAAPSPFSGPSPITLT